MTLLVLLPAAAPAGSIATKIAGRIRRIFLIEELLDKSHAAGLRKGDEDASIFLLASKKIYCALGVITRWVNIDYPSALRSSRILVLERGKEAVFGRVTSLL
jgi:hypothetical protein